MPRKILIIEDDPSSARLVEYILKKEGYQVAVATNGLEGLARARSDAPDLAILDVMLPGIDGFEVAHRLKGDPKTRRMPILMLSAKSRESDKQTGYKVGADAYLPKPSEPSEIVQTVARLLQQITTAEPASRALAFIGCSLAVGTTTVVVNLAVLLADAGSKVTILDLSPFGGQAAGYLGIKPGRKLSEFLSDPEMPPELIDSFAASHPSGAKLLSGTAADLGADAARLNLLLDYCKSKTNFLLIDLPMKEVQVLRSIGGKLDQVVLVSSSAPDGLTNVKAQAGFIFEEMAIAREKAGAIIVDRNGVFERAEIDKLQTIVESMIKLPLIGIVPYDVKASLDFESKGTPVVTVEPARATAVAVRKIASRYLALESRGTARTG